MQSILIAQCPFVSEYCHLLACRLHGNHSTIGNCQFEWASISFSEAKGVSILLCCRASTWLTFLYMSDGLCKRYTKAGCLWLCYVCFLQSPSSRLFGEPTSTTMQELKVRTWNVPILLFTQITPKANTTHLFTNEPLGIACSADGLLLGRSFHAVILVITGCEFNDKNTRNKWVRFCNLSMPRVRFRTNLTLAGTLQQPQGCDVATGCGENMRNRRGRQIDR